MNTTDLTLKQMFDISAKLVAEQDEISIYTIRWEKHSWKYLSLIGDETIINLQRAKVYVFSDSVLCLGKIHQHPRHQQKTEDSMNMRLDQIWTLRINMFVSVTAQPRGVSWNSNKSRHNKVRAHWNVGRQCVMTVSSGQRRSNRADYNRLWQIER